MDLQLGYASKSQGQVLYHKLKVLTPSEQEQEVQKEESLIKKYIKKLVPVSYESEEIKSKSLHPELQEKLEKTVLKTVEPLDTAHAVVIKFATTLQSRLGKTYSYYLTGMVGEKVQTIERKTICLWDILANSQQTMQGIRLTGTMKAPILPIWDIHAIRASMVDYKISNIIRYYDEILLEKPATWRINMDTQAKTSLEQKEYSR